MEAEMTRAWDAFDAERTDLSGSTEETAHTEEAHHWALHVAAAQCGIDGFEFARGGSRLRLRVPASSGSTYVAEVRGQSSAAAHGKHGADPLAIAELRQIDEPVLLVFVEKSAKTVYTVWLDADVEVVNIDNDRTHRRQGWRCQDMTRHSGGGFRFPTEVPHFETKGLF